MPTEARAGVNGCSVASASVAFSPYDVVAKSAVDATGTLSISCSGNNPSNAVTVELSGGASGACARTLTKWAETMSYGVYQRSALIQLVFDHSHQ